MIKLHHLNKSRSKRIIWLLEELKQPYEIIGYQRNASNFLAPEELANIHRLGKAPVVEVDGLVLAESGAITEYLIERYAPSTLAPSRDSIEFGQYLYWIHCSESSAILPPLIKVYMRAHGDQHESMARYANSEEARILNHIEQELEGKSFLVADKLTGADIMMSFVIELLYQSGKLSDYPNISSYYQRMLQIPGFQKAKEAEKQHDATA